MSKLDEMPAISLWQPWATLISVGVKWIETRPWCAPQSMIGKRIAIHAAKKLPDLRQMYGDYIVSRDPDGWWLVNFRDDDDDVTKIELGAVVATAKLDACIPMISGLTFSRVRPALLVTDNVLWHHERIGGMVSSTDVSAQRPYGNFAGGRWAWMLSDVRKLREPVPARGRQQVFYVDLT